MIGFLTEYYQYKTQNTDSYIYNSLWSIGSGTPPNARLIIAEEETRWIDA
jgi:hypothetical protein